METIHIKTVDPVSQELLRAAAQQGLRLNWERYEKLQPQDGFLRVGLSCPFGCLQGPCRIDPFGHGPDRGLCGLDRDGMVAAMLLRLTFHGALEAMNDVSTPDNISQISWPAPLDEIVVRALKNLGGDGLSLKEIYRSAFFLHRPMEPPERLIVQALRLGILTLGLLEKRRTPGDVRGSFPCKAGWGLLAGHNAIIGICGQPNRELIEILLQEASRKSSVPLQLVSLGDWVPLNDGFLPCACTSGEAEMLLSSGRVNLVLAGQGTDPSFPEMCRSLDIPLIASQGLPEAEEILRLARQSYGVRSRASFTPDPSMVREARVIMDPQGLEGFLKRESFTSLALLGGADTPQQPFGWIPVELASALRGEGRLVAGWGDAALWMIKSGLASDGDGHAVQILDPNQAPLLALKALATSGKLENLQGVCFTGLKACRDLGVALGLASLGVRVCVAVPLPLWGSEKVRKLLEEKLATGGGILTYYDHLPHAQEILKWFLKEEK